MADQVDSAKDRGGAPPWSITVLGGNLGHGRPHPILDRGDLIAVRDPALVFHDGVCHCFHTVARPAGPAFSLGIDVAVSRDLTDWRTQTIFAPSPSNWSSPGSIVRQGDDWVMCLQSYPIPPGACWAD